MYCENCGHKLEEGHKFCTKCGSVANNGKAKAVATTTDEKWWYRFMKVVYITLYIPLPFILWAVWDSYAYHTYYASYSRTWQSYGDNGEAFWYTLITLAIYVAVVRLIKIAVLYIAVGRKPQWRQEFRKPF